MYVSEMVFHVHVWNFLGNDFYSELCFPVLEISWDICHIVEVYLKIYLDAL